MDEDLFSIEEEFQLKDCDKDEHLKHLRQLEEQRNAEEQKEIELERIQRQIINKLNITEKSDNEPKAYDNAEMSSLDKTTRKQNGVHKYGKNDASKPFKTVQRSSDRRKVQSNRPMSSFHSGASSSHNHNSHYKDNPHQREGFHNMRQQRSHRGSRWRPSNYQRHQERYHIRLPNNLEQEFDHPGKQQIEHTEEQTNENFEFALPTELFPTNVEEEQEMLQEALELSKQQMFIDKLERREVDKAIEETTRSHQMDSRMTQQQSNDRIVNKEVIDELRTSLLNSNHSIASDGKHGANSSNKHEKSSHSQTNIAGNSKPMKPNKMQKPWLNDKQNCSANKDSFQVRYNKSRNSYQTQKRSLDVCKQNPINQIETMIPRTDTVCDTLVHSNSNNIAEYDMNSTKWKECARKDLKQLLHLDNSPDPNNRTDCIKGTTEVVETSADHSNTIGAEAGNRHDMSINEVPYTNNFNGRPPAKSNCNSSHIENRNNCVVPVSFGSQNYSSSHKTGARSRINERRTTRVLRKGKPSNNGTNDGESVCANWVPYRKLMEEGRTESIPPRFRKQCQQITY